MIAVAGIIGAVFAGIVVLAITPTLYAHVPDSSDIAKMLLNETAKLWACGDNIPCKQASERALATIDMYQKLDSARGTTQTFGVVLIVLPTILGIVALKNS